MKRWIATCVDCGETCDGKARIIGVLKGFEEACAFVRNDIEYWADKHAGENVEVDFDKMSASCLDSGDGCDWNIEEVEIPV